MADKDADVIIIGAGHNSLAAALYLQKAGHKVLIIELSAVAGGAAKTADLLEPGFKHDLYATNIGQFLGSRVYADFKGQFHQNGFDIVVANQPFSNVFPDRKCIRMYTDPEKTAAEFERFSAQDARAWAEMVTYFKTVSPYLFPVLQLPMPSLKLAMNFWKMYRRLGLAETLDLMRILVTPTRYFLGEWFESREAKALISPWPFHLGLSPDCAGGATFSFLESVADHLNGLALSKGGVGNLMNAMVATIKGTGGEFMFGQRVSGIIVEKGIARGITTGDGQKYYAKKGVLANVTPHQFVDLVGGEDLPGKFVTRCKNYQFGPGTVMIHCTLDRPLEWEAAEDLRDSAYVHIGPYMSDIATTYQQIMQHHLPTSPLLVVAQQSRLDPERAPAGKHVMWVQVRAFPQKVKGDAGGTIKVGSWDAMKEFVADRVISKIAEYAPSIQSIVRNRVVHSPRDLEDDDPNLVGGDMVGGSHHMHQYLFFRPVSGWSRYRTPIKRLFITGQSTWPGCGLNASSGYLAAMEMIKNI